MKNKLRLLAVALVAGGTMFAAPRVSIGIGVGVGSYPPPPAYAQYQSPCPGPGYSWVDGYWAPQGGRNVWVSGFWRAPAVKVAPHYVEPRHEVYRDNHGQDHDRDAWNRGGDRHDNRGNAFVNGFRR